MTLIPKLVCPERCAPPAPSPSGRAGPSPRWPVPGRPPERWGGRGGSEGRAASRQGRGRPSRRDSSHLAWRDMKEATDATSAAEHHGSPAGVPGSSVQTQGARTPAWRGLQHPPPPSPSRPVPTLSRYGPRPPRPRLRAGLRVREGPRALEAGPLVLGRTLL